MGFDTDRVRERVGVIDASLDNSVGDISVVKSDTNEDLENERVRDASDDYRDARFDAIGTRVKFFPTMNFVNWVGFCLLVLDGSEIVERGTHEDLLDVDGLYANCWRVQVGEVDALPEEFLGRTAHREVSNPSG